MHVSDSAIAHGDERQDMALGTAGRGVHARKRNRIHRGGSRKRCRSAGQQPGDDDEHNQRDQDQA